MPTEAIGRSEFYEKWQFFSEAFSLSLIAAFYTSIQCNKSKKAALFCFAYLNIIPSVNEIPGKPEKTWDFVESFNWLCDMSIISSMELHVQLTL